MMKLNFGIVHDHNFSLSEVEDMLPWEREIYLHQINHWVQQRNKQIAEANRRG